MQMFFYIRNLSAFSLLLAVLACLFSSCGNTRQLTLMQGQFDTARLSQIQISDPVIRKGDLVSIIVYSDNPQATALYNQSLIIVNSNAGATGGSSGGASGGSGGSGG